MKHFFSIFSFFFDCVSYSTKALLLIFSLVFFLNNSLKAQCEQYGFFVELTGFVCDDYGTICFVTNADLIDPPVDCADYVVEIEFPTGSFIIGPNSDFDIIQSSPATTTILQHDPGGAFNSDADYRACVEGLLQIPDVEYTMRIVDPNDPNDIINSVTFKLDDVKTIEDMTVSNAISLGLLEDPAVAVNTGQRVVIEGTLTVDQDYIFGVNSDGGLMNDIMMNPDARIEIEDGYELRTLRANIHACEDNWDRINIQSGGTFSTIYTEIYDAEVGIELQDNATILSWFSSIYNCDIGLGSFGINAKNISILILSQWTALTIRDCEQGARFEHVNDLLLDNIFFRNTPTGIYLDESDLTGEFLDFLGFDVGVRGQSYTNMLELFNCRFEDGTYGIYQTGYITSNIHHNEFEYVDYGVIKQSLQDMEHTLIEYNYMFDNETNVYAATRPSTNSEIQFNDLFSLDNPNVLIFGYGEGDHDWSVQHNPIIASNTYNVVFVGVDRGRIFENTDIYADITNFHVSGGERAWIGLNDEMSCSGGHGIRIFGNPGGFVYCNDITSSDIGININNNCAKKTILGNQMHSNSFNLTYGSTTNTFAHTGQQGYHGNIFDSSSEGDEKARNFGSATEAEQNQYLVGELAGNQGSPIFPFFISNFNMWFIDNNTLNYECPDNAIIPQEEDAILALRNTALSHIALLDIGIDTLYNQEVVFDVYVKLFRTLDKLDQLNGLDSVLQPWYTTLSTTDYADFIAFERTMANAIALTDAEYDQVTQLHDTIYYLTNAIQNIEWISFDTTNYTISIDTPQQVIADAKRSELAQHKTTLSNLLSTKRQALLAVLPTMESINTAIGSQATLSGTKLKNDKCSAGKEARRNTIYGRRGSDHY